MAKITYNKFVKTGYTSNSGIVYVIKQSIVDNNAQPTADVGVTATSDVTATIGGSRKRRGVHARGVRLVRVTGTSPNVLTRYSFMAVLLPADYEAITKTTTFNLGGVTWNVDDKIPEVIR